MGGGGGGRRGGEGGGLDHPLGGGGEDTRRASPPQSLQSVPRAQAEYSDPGPPSSQMPLLALEPVEYQ